MVGPLEPKHNNRIREGRLYVVGGCLTKLSLYCDAMPGPNETVSEDRWEEKLGGKGALQAVAAARNGASTSLVCALGPDAWGKARREDLFKEGIDCSRVNIKKNGRSGRSLTLIGPAKGRGRGRRGRFETKYERRTVISPGANMRLTRTDVRKGLVGLKARDVVLGSLDVPVAAVEEAFRIARKAGCMTILDPDPWPISGIPNKLLRLTTVLTPNEKEFTHLFGTSPDKAGAKASLRSLLRPNHRHGVALRHCVVTLGSRGAAWHFIPDPKTQEHEPLPAIMEDRRTIPEMANTYGSVFEYLFVPSYAPLRRRKAVAPGVPAIDATAVGDCFNGCLAAALLEDPSQFERALRFAVAGATYAVSRRGGRVSIPRKEDTLRLMKKVS